MLCYSVPRAARMPLRRTCLPPGSLMGPAHRGALAANASSGTNSGAYTVPTPEARS
jgi:hypothetical protein